MMFGKKRGLSPVIATVLLVAMVLVLATIIFIWARSFVGETLTKERREISLSCEDVAFTVNALNIGANTTFEIENTGTTVPIYGLEIRKKKLIGESSIGGVEKLDNGIGRMVAPGESGATDEKDFGLVQGDNTKVVPILVGLSSTNNIKSYVCDESYGVEVIVA